MVAEWSKTLVQIQVAISPLQTQVQSSLGTCIVVQTISFGRRPNQYTAISSKDGLIRLFDCELKM